MRLSLLAAGVRGTAVESGAEYEVRRIVQDSRQARPGDLFVAIRGERVDGHDFATVAANRGAALGLEHAVPHPSSTACLHLGDSRAALGPCLRREQ